MANWPKRSVRRASLAGIYATGSKPQASPAMVTSNPVVSNKVMRQCRISRGQVLPGSGKIQPSGLITPMPVTTTRFELIESLILWY